MKYFVMFLVVMLFAPSSIAEDRVMIDARTKRGIDKALHWLERQQNPDGSWGNTAITSFALLAFMANGHVPDQGIYGADVIRGIRYLLASARNDGYLVDPQHGGNMYCHGLAALVLSQAYGMTNDPEVRRTLRKSIDLIIRTQNHEGGWRYDPAPNAADISVTIIQVMALRGAKDSGIHVPDETFRKAFQYISSCYDAESGGYLYQPRHGGPGYARTAAGVCVLQLCGEYEADQIQHGVEYLERQGNDPQHYWYGHYYAAHALHQIGGKTWSGYYNRMRARLLATQKNAGHWLETMEESVGAVYQTSIAVLVLSVPTNYLPIYQR